MRNIVFIALLLSSSVLFSQKKTLFNGENLEGWEIFGSELWYVEDGLLIGKNGPNAEFGYLATKEHYQNFELTLEFKKNEASNGGVFVRSVLSEGEKPTGWQVEIARTGHFTGGIHEYERGWLVKPEEDKDKIHKVDEWNQMKIKVVGGTITSWLNGVEMANLKDEKVAMGKGGIAFQIHSGNSLVAYKNIELIEL